MRHLSFLTKLLTILLLVPQCNWAIPQHLTLTLKDAIFLALRYNPRIKSQEFLRINQKFALRQARNEFELQYALEGNLRTSRTKNNGQLAHSQSYDLVPSVSLRSPFGTDISLNMNNGSDGNFYNPGVTLQISQPLLRGAGSNVVLAPLRNAYDQEAINRIQLRQTISSQVVQVINSYYNVISAERSVDIQKDSLKRAQDNVRNTQRFIDAGQRAPMEIYQARSSVSTARFQITRQENALREQIQTLLTNIGLDPLTQVYLPKTVPTPNYRPPSRKQAIAIALKNDPSYQISLLNLKVAKRNLLVQQNNQLWELNATANATWGYGTGGYPFNNFHSIINGSNTSQQFGMTLSVPINDLQRQSTLVTAKVTLKNLQIELRNTKRTVITNVINGLHSLEASRIEIKEAQEGVKFQRINLANAYKQAAAGTLDQLSVSQQQERLTVTEQSLRDARLRYVNNITSFRELLQQTLQHWKIKIRY